MTTANTKVRKVLLTTFAASILVGLSLAYIAAMTTTFTAASIAAEPFLVIAAASTLGYLTLWALPFGQRPNIRRRYVQRRLNLAG